MGRPKGSFRIRLEDGKTLSVAVFPTKRDPSAEVISVQVQNYEDETWKNYGKMAIYRSSEGSYSQLPDQQRQTD